MTGGGIRAARNLSAAAVATIAGWSSYHMVHVALHDGERPEVAYGLPFSVGGMLVVATIVMVDDKRRAHRVRTMARLAFTAGVIASIAANIAATQRPQAVGGTAAPATAGAPGSTVGGQGSTTRHPTSMTRRLANTVMAAEPQLSRNELARRLGVSTRRLREVLAA